jgi:hypothetical protein
MNLTETVQKLNEPKCTTWEKNYKPMGRIIVFLDGEI